MYEEKKASAVYTRTFKRQSSEARLSAAGCGVEYVRHAGGHEVPFSVARRLARFAGARAVRSRARAWSLATARWRRLAHRLDGYGRRGEAGPASRRVSRA